MDPITYAGVSDYKAEGTLAERPPPCLNLVWAGFLQTDVVPHQAFWCLRTGPGEADFDWINVTGGAAPPNVQGTAYANVFAYSNASNGPTVVVERALVNTTGHEILRAGGIFTQTAGGIVGIALTDLDSSTTVLLVTPNMPAGAAQFNLSVAVPADLPPGPRNWALTATNTVGETLSAIFAWIEIQQLSDSAA